MVGNLSFVAQGHKSAELIEVKPRFQVGCIGYDRPRGRSSIDESIVRLPVVIVEVNTAPDYAIRRRDYLQPRVTNLQ